MPGAEETNISENSEEFSVFKALPIVEIAHVTVECIRDFAGAHHNNF
jgi:hypothetical protein